MGFCIQMTNGNVLCHGELRLCCPDADKIRSDRSFNFIRDRILDVSNGRKATLNAVGFCARAFHKLSEVRDPRRVGWAGPRWARRRRGPQLTRR